MGWGIPFFGDKPGHPVCRFCRLRQYRFGRLLVRSSAAFAIVRIVAPTRTIGRRSSGRAPRSVSIPRGKFSLREEFPAEVAQALMPFLAFDAWRGSNTAAGGGSPRCVHGVQPG